MARFIADDKKGDIRALKGGCIQRLAEGARVKLCGVGVGKIQEALHVGLVGRLNAHRHRSDESPVWLGGRQRRPRTALSSG